MNFLLLDVGNTHIDIWCYDSNSDSIIFRFKSETKNYHDNFIKNDQLRSVLSIYSKACICSVKDEAFNDEIIQFLHHNFCIDTEYIDKQDVKLIESSYSDFNLLGNDRWISLIGLFLQGEKNYCAIDCGTAVTVDYVIQGKHKGGLIVPGLSTMKSALLLNTDGICDIKNLDENNIDNYMENTTDQCINRGTSICFNAFIDDVISNNTYTHSDLKFYISGGDAKNYFNRLNFEHIVTLDNLVLNGLKQLIKYQYIEA